MATPDPSTSHTLAPRFMQPLRAMPIKIVYTLNDNIQQFFLARHTPIAVRVVQKPPPSRRQRQRAARELKAQQSGTSSAPSSAKKATPSRPRPDDASRTDGPNTINVDDDSEEHSVGAEERVEYGLAPLKVCISAVWAASPDLAYDRTRDWSIYCLDPLEQSAVTSPPASDVASKFSGVMTGMGLTSHAMQEDDRVLNPVSVTGKIVEDQGEEALEVILQMKATMPQAAMIPQYPGWPQHPMMYPYPQHPAFFRPPLPGPSTYPNHRPQAVNKRTKSTSAASVSTPAPSDAATPDAATTVPSRDPSVEPVKMVRSASSEPKPVQTKKKKPVVPLTSHPLTRAPAQSATKEQSPVASLSQTGHPMEILSSLATRLNSVDGGTEPPAPDTAEGQLLDCMVAWLKSAAGSHLSGAIGFSADTPAASSSQTTDATSPADSSTSPANISETASQSQSTSTQGAENTEQHSPSSSQPGQPSISSGSRSKPGRTILGNKSNVMDASPVNKNGGDGKTAIKPLLKRTGGPSAPRKRSLDDEEHNTIKPKRQKVGRSISGSSAGTSAAGSSKLLGTSASGRGLLDFPSSSEILGIKFAPRRPGQTSLSQGEEDTSKTPAIEPQTPRPRKKGQNPEPFSLPLTSPFVSGNAVDESLFSEAGTPAVLRNFSPFKPLKRAVDQVDALADDIRPSSPCERRANASIGKSKDFKTPQMIGRSLTGGSSSPETRTPQPHWAVDLPPSSPPPPSSPNASSTPADGEDEEEPLEEPPPAESEGLVTDESPSKAFSRMFNVTSNAGNDLASTLLADAQSDSKEYDFGFDFGFADVEGSNNLGGRSSSSSSVFDDFGWSDGFLNGGNTGNSSEAEFDGDTTAPSGDLDFDIGDLLSWMQANPGVQTSGQSGSRASSTNTQALDETTAEEEEDPLRKLLGGCVV